MNIEEYRAMKAEMEQSKEDKQDAQTQSATDGTVPPEQKKDAEPEGGAEQKTQSTETNQTDEPSEKAVDTTPPEPQPTTVEIDGKHVTIDELKNGYLRQDDYTRKTQDLSREQRKAQEAMDFMNTVQSNPDVAQQLSQQYNIPIPDPAQQKIADLENKYYDLMVQNEITTLSQKYPDFNVNEVLQTARDNGLKDLDTAYHVVKSRKGETASAQQETSLSQDELRTQLRNELLEELRTEQASQADTSTIIQSGGDTAPVKDNSPKLSRQEAKVAGMMGMSPKDYATWRDASTKK